MSNADSLYKAHSNNSFDSQSQYTGRYLKIFEQQTKNSKIGASIFSHQQKKQHTHTNQILPQSYSPSYPEKQQDKYYEYITKQQKENEIFGDLQRMRNQHLKIMGLMEDKETESSRKMGEIQKQIVQRRSVQQHYMPEYNPPTFNNLNSREGRNSIESRTQSIQRKGSVQNYLTHHQQIKQETNQINNPNQQIRLLKQQQVSKQQQNNNQRRFTFFPGGNNYEVAGLDKIDNKVNQYQMDSPHHNLKDTIEFQPIGNPSSAQFVHYQKQQNQKGYNEFQDSSLSYNEMKQNKVSNSQNIKYNRDNNNIHNININSINNNININHNNQNRINNDYKNNEIIKQQSRGIILGSDVKVVESKLQSGGRLIAENSKNRIESKVLERRRFSQKQLDIVNKQPQTQPIERMEKGPPQTSIKTIEMRQNYKNIHQQSTNRNQVQVHYQNQYQLPNEVLAKVSINQGKVQSKNNIRPQSHYRNQKINNQPPLNPQALIETVSKQINSRQNIPKVTSSLGNNLNYLNQRISEGKINQNIKPILSYDLGMAHQKVEQINLQQNHFQVQNGINHPQQQQQQQHYPQVFNKPPLINQIQIGSPKHQNIKSLIPPLSPRTHYPPVNTPLNGIRKSIGLAHHNRIQSPARRIQNQFSARPQIYNDYYYNMAKNFPIHENSLKKRLASPNIASFSPSRIPNTIRPTSSGPRVLSPRPKNHPSQYIPTALLPQNNKNYNLAEINYNQIHNFNNIHHSNQPFTSRPFSPNVLVSRAPQIRPTSVQPQTSRTNLPFNQMRPISPSAYQINSGHTQRAKSPPPRQKVRQGISVTSKR